MIIDLSKNETIKQLQDLKNEQDEISDNLYHYQFINNKKKIYL